MKLTHYALSLSFVALAVVPVARAQTSFDVNMGFGTARAGANGGGIEGPTSVNAYAACTPSPADPTCTPNPSLSGFFLGLGGDLIFQKHFGVGAEVSFQPARSDYGPLQYRQTFYDFNGIFLPVNQKRAQIQVQGGIGGAKTGFSFTQTSCIGVQCTTVTQPVTNANHFQLHVGVGVQIFVTEHIFVRPQFDLHYVPNFTEEFGRSSVPGASVWVGYSFGDRS